MNIKKIIAGIMAFCLMGGVMPNIADVVGNAIITASAVVSTEGTYEQLKYISYGDHIEITACDKDITEVVIPSEIEGLPVTNIGEWAFEDCSGLTSIKIPDSVTNIGEGAFADCSGLTSINVSENNENYVSMDGILFSKDKTELIQYPSGKTGTEYTVPDSVVSIGAGAFYGCSLTSINISDSVASISDSALLYCLYLTSINVSEDNENYSDLNGILFNKNKTELIQYLSGKTETEYTVPDSVVSIGYGAFSNCPDLTSINIPDSVTGIEEGAFSGCSGLTSINIPDGVTSIDGFVFSGCSGLTSINIPDSVTSIGESTFYGCSGLTSINIPDSVTSIEYGTFENCSGLTSINIPNSVTNIEYGAFLGCSGLTSIIIPDSVTSIGDFAFYDCSVLTSIKILNPDCNVYMYVISNGCDENDEPYFNGTIYGYKNSTAQAYAEKYGYKFELIGGAVETSMGDIDGNGIIDANDASVVLAEYSLLATGDSGTFTEDMKKFADINNDGQIDSVDSSLILSYYAYTSTGGTDDIEKFLETSE